MAPETTAKHGKSGFSLYANLLEKSSNESIISRAPVVFKQPQEGLQDEDSSPKQLSAAALRFPPTKRPLTGAQKARPIASAVKSTALANQIPKPEAGLPKNTQAAVKTSIADWTGDDDDVNGFYGSEKRQRGGRKKRKKNRAEAPVVHNWDDIYDPSRPNSYEEYKNSEEKIQEIRDWKDRLYAHRESKHDSEPSSEDERPARNNRFAPPPISFAPPTSTAPVPEQAVPPNSLVDDASGEDAYERRLRLSQMPVEKPVEKLVEEVKEVKEPLPATTISRAPVRYQLPLPPSELPASEKDLRIALQAEEDPSAEEAAEDEPRSLRPGQKGFAARLMSKYGWTKGSGLGAEGDGIVNPLRVQIEKQKKRPDSEGGGFVGPGGRGKIIGGSKKIDSNGSSAGRFGPMSQVVILHGMVDGMDLDTELGDGNLMQEIGEECSDKYGRVERVFINRSTSSESPVFVKFTSELSALRAVNALEGRIFNGNVIKASFFDLEKFEKAIYT